MILNQRQTRLLVALGTGISLSLPGDQTLYAVLPTRANAVGLSLGMVGVLLGVNRVVRIPGNPLAGLLYDRFGRRRLFLLGLLLGVLSTASYAVARSFPEWLVGRLLWGIAWSLLNVGGLTMVLDVTDDHDRGRVTGLYQLAYLLGLAFSPVLGGLLTDVLDFRPALLVCAAITGAGFVATYLILPETRPNPSAASLHLPRWETCVSALKQTFRRLPFWKEASPSAPSDRQGEPQRQIGGHWAINYVYLMTFFAGNGVVMSTISLYLKQNFGEEILVGGTLVGVASLGGILLAMRSLVGMVAGPLFGHLSDRRGDRWSMVMVGILIGGIGFGTLIVGRTIWVVPGGVILIALSTGILLTTLAALTGDLATSDRQGWTMGRLATAGDVGSAAGPLLAYALLSLIELRWVYLLCSLGFASSLLVIRYAGDR